MTSCKQIQRRMSSKNPITFGFTFERMQTLTLRHVPHTNALILAIGQDELLSWMEHCTWYIVPMSPASVHFPSLVLIHTPKFHNTIVTTGHNQRQRWMETGPVHATVMTLKHVLNNSISSSKEICCSLQFWQIIQAARTRCNILLAQSLFANWK